MLLCIPKLCQHLLLLSLGMLCPSSARQKLPNRGLAMVCASPAAPRHPGPLQGTDMRNCWYILHVGSALAQRPTEKAPGFPLVLPLSSTRTHHNLSVDVAAQSTGLTFTAQQEKQQQELPPAPDPLVLQVHLGLAMAVGRLVPLKHQSKGLGQREAENTAGRLSSPESSRARRKEERTWSQMSAGSAT